MNLASLGARAGVVGVVGDDEAGRELLDRLSAAGVDCGGVVVTAKARTTTKTRILAGHAHSPRHQVVRVDYESGPLSDSSTVAEIARRVRAGFDGSDALIVSDHNYGVPLNIEAVGSHDAVDVTGAGDTVIAAYALALASGASFTDAARLANHAGGIVVLKRGTACVYAQELVASVLQEGV